MNKEIKCTFEWNDHFIELKKDLDDFESLEEVVHELAINELTDYCDIFDIFYSFKYNWDRPIDAYDIVEDLYSFTENYAMEIPVQIPITVDWETAAGKDREQFTLNLGEVFLKVLHDRMEDPDCYSSDIAWAIGKAIDYLDNNGTWKVCLSDRNSFITDPNEWPQPIIKNGSYLWKTDSNNYIPVIWFGVSDKPITPFIISTETDEDEFSFWFEEDEETIMDKIVENWNGETGYWFYEEGNYPPSLEDIRKKCPIELDEFDDKDNIKEKLTNLFLEIQNITKL